MPGGTGDSQARKQRPRASVLEHSSRKQPHGVPHQPAGFVFRRERQGCVRTGERFPALLLRWSRYPSSRDVRAFSLPTNSEPASWALAASGVGNPGPTCCPGRARRSDCLAAPAPPAVASRARACTGRMVAKLRPSYPWSGPSPSTKGRLPSLRHSGSLHPGLFGRWASA